MFVEGVDCEESNDRVSHRNNVAKVGLNLLVIKVRWDSRMSIGVEQADQRLIEA
jgi:hypothetical protein